MDFEVIENKTKSKNNKKTGDSGFAMSIAISQAIAFVE